MKVVGVDLAGPSNHRDTVMAVFQHTGGKLELRNLESGVSDLSFLNAVEELSESDHVVIGIDAPLSYADGGGDRAGDKELRKYIVSLGMRSGSIMSPTYSRMAYLTLRGIRLTRELERLPHADRISIVEVHPGAAISSRIDAGKFFHVLEYKKGRSSREFMLGWFKEQQLKGIPEGCKEESHLIDACAAALSAWHWADPELKSRWLYPADPPLNPYDYCC
ncbi:DUF429 domain-containing protein [Bacillus sp. H-16]|uniref:DUF429 domain-containing protein n=1 Tax=Alteribacter salitolerans TaxID=2912333 RepID=UPI001962E2F5|nr:DUF429 domain-containing protein [Alteribacter salitolerans]MBM7094387.1 DUF429 domain-containing protein [Alteribacter salitolerans]